MADVDLVSKKILGTDPQVGFGESAVLPYRERVLDTRGFEAMERAKGREEARKEARKKNNEDYYHAAIKSLPQYEREHEQNLGAWRDSIVTKGGEIISRGGNLTQDVGYAKEVMQFAQAANASKAMKQDLEREDKLSPYTDGESFKGAKLKKYTELVERANKGDRTAFSESIMPNPDDPEFFMFDKYYNDQYGNRKDSSVGGEYISYGPNGERIIGKKFTSNFMTKDAKGNVVAGVDPSIIEEDLYGETNDPAKLQFRAALSSLADKQIMKKALELKASGDPRYSDMGVNQIAVRIGNNPDDSYYKEFNKKKLVEDMHRKKVESYLRVSTDKSVGALNEYNKGDGSDAKDFRIVPAVISQNSASGNVANSAGVTLTKNDKPLTLLIAPKKINDFGTGKIYDNNDRVNLKATGVGFALRTKKGGVIVSSKGPDELVDYINTASLKDLEKYSLDQFVFGTIEEKKTVGGDTGKDEPVDETGSPNKSEQTINRSVAVDYDPQGETGALLDAYSGGTFSKRELSPDEKKVKDAWEKRMAKKSKASDKPLTVVQNGHTYTLNQETGDYE